MSAVGSISEVVISCITKGSYPRGCPYLSHPAPAPSFYHLGLPLHVEYCDWTQVGKSGRPGDRTEIPVVARVSGLIVTLLSSFFPGGPLQNGQPSAEIQEEVALTSLGSGPAATNKRHSTSDKMHFPRSSLQPITTLGMSP